MQFFLIDVGTSVAALLGYLALVAAKRRYALTLSAKTGRRRGETRA
jgi:hypothetical protein